MTEHRISTKVTHRDDRRYTKVTCACGADLGQTDSSNRVAEIADEHLTTPECPWCKHRAKHHPSTGCENISTVPDRDGYVSCTCKGQCAKCSHAQHVGQCTHRSFPGPEYDGLKRESALCFCGLVTDYD